MEYHVCYVIKIMGPGQLTMKCIKDSNGQMEAQRWMMVVVQLLSRVQLLRRHGL